MVGGLGSDVVVEIESPELMIGFASWVIQKIGIQRFRPFKSGCSVAFFV